MDIDVTLEFYDRIMNSSNKATIGDLEIELKKAILGKEITDTKDIMLLNLALKTKQNEYKIEELFEVPAQSMIVMDDIDQVNEIMNALFGEQVHDHEQAQLDEMLQEELDDFKDGNVVSIGNFKQRTETDGDDDK